MRVFVHFTFIVFGTHTHAYTHTQAPHICERVAYLAAPSAALPFDTALKFIQANAIKHEAFNSSETWPENGIKFIAIVFGDA